MQDPITSDMAYCNSLITGLSPVSDPLNPSSTCFQRDLSICQIWWWASSALNYARALLLEELGANYDSAIRLTPASFPPPLLCSDYTKWCDSSNKINSHLALSLARIPSSPDPSSPFCLSSCQALQEILLSLLKNKSTRHHYFRPLCQPDVCLSENILLILILAQLFFSLWIMDCLLNHLCTISHLIEQIINKHLLFYFL